MRQRITWILVGLYMAAMGAAYAGGPADFGIKNVVFSFRSNDLSEFEQYAKLAKKAGATHVDVSQLPEKSWWQRPDRADPYPQWVYINPSIFKAYIPKALAGYIPAEPQQRFLDVMKKRCEILRRLGLKGYFDGGEPMMLPERVYEDHPLWRGPRVDKPLRSLHAQFTPAIEHPEVKALYREAMAGLIKNCPEIKIFRFLTNDSGSGIDWAPGLYPGPNGNALFAGMSMGERVAGFMEALQRGAADAGVEGIQIALNSPGAEAREIRDSPAVREFGDGMVLQNQMKDGSQWSSFTGVHYYFNALYPLVGIPQHLRFVRELEQAVEVKAPVLLTFIDVEMGTLYFDLFQRFFEQPTNGRLSRQRFLYDYAAGIAGKKNASLLAEMWNDIADSVDAHWPINYGWYGGHVFLIGTAAGRWLNRPFVPFPKELKPEEYRYYRPYLFQARGLDRAVDMADLQGIRLVAGQGASRICGNLLRRAERSIREARAKIGKVNKSLPNGKVRRDLDTLDIRLRAYSLVCRNARNTMSYQEKMDYAREKGIKPDPNPRFARGKDPFRLEVIGTARAEMDNAAQLIELLESTDVPLFATTDDPDGEDSFTFGPNLVETLRMKIKIMRAHWLDYDRIFTRP